MAMTAASWDPTQYLRFSNERLRPALDLLAQVPLETASHVVDLGCGAGNVTAILRRRFPTAAVIGVDGSDTMLAKARAAASDCQFVQADFAAFAPDTPPDLIFSNAALHWAGQVAAAAAPTSVVRKVLRCMGWSLCQWECAQTARGIRAENSLISFPRPYAQSLYSTHVWRFRRSPLLSKNSHEPSLETSRRDLVGAPPHAAGGPVRGDQHPA